MFSVFWNSIQSFKNRCWIRFRSIFINLNLFINFKYFSMMKAKNKYAASNFDEMTAFEKMIKIFENKSRSKTRYEMKLHFLKKKKQFFLNYATYFESIWDFIERDRETWSRTHFTFDNLTTRYQEFEAVILTIKRNRNRFEKMKKIILH